MRVLILPLVSLCWVLAIAASNSVRGADVCGADSERSAADTYQTHSVRGRVVWLADVLARRHGIQTVAEAAQRVLTLETADGALIPIIEDVRGRSFRRDSRLRNVDLQLRVRQYTGSPFVQVINIYLVHGDQLLEVDYWCEVCSIAMYELKPCDCCQGEIDLRTRPVSP